MIRALPRNNSARISGENNVLFARNLYPGEMAQTLARAM
jgi:hypothetical protein